MTDKSEFVQRSEKSPPYYEAAAIVGIEIDARKLYHDEQSRCCTCFATSDLDKAWLYCPTCGKPIWESRITLIPQWDAGDPARPTLCELPVISTAAPDTKGLEMTPLGRCVIRAGVRLFVGELVSRTDMGNMARRQSLSESEMIRSRDRLRTLLAPLGLWDESKWGLWAVINRVG